MKRGSLAAALLCSALGLSWQLLTVHFNYGGNLTALFCHGSQFPLPPGLAAEHIYVFPDSGGYDGQSYHYMAHDPFDRTDIGRAVPDPSLRYPRILLPGMAHLLALGRPSWIDVSYLLCGLLFLGLGAYWLAQLLARIGVHPLFAALYVAVPGVIISLDRMLVDLAVTSLALGFALCLDSDRPWNLPAAEPHWTAGRRVVRPPMAGSQLEPDGVDPADILEGRNRPAQDEGECEACGAAQGAVRGADRTPEGGGGSVANELGVPVV